MFVEKDDDMCVHMHEFISQVGRWMAGLRAA